MRRFRSRRLAMRIYLSGTAFVLLLWAVLFVLRRYVIEPPWQSGLGRQGAYVIERVAETRGDPARFQAEIARIHDEVGGEIAFYDRQGKLVAGSAQPPPPLGAEELGRIDSEGVIVIRSTRTIAERLPDDTVAVFAAPRPKGPWEYLAIDIAVIVLAAGLASVLLARALTRPLERLAGAARALGEGELAVRSGIRRKDEIGEVARTFDDMAERLTGLIRAQKELLANVSHELRTPLSRIRVALDLAAEGDTTVLSEIAQDLGELEQLIDDILTTARLELAEGRGGAAQPLRKEPIEPGPLLERAAERLRSAHAGAVVKLELASPLPPVTGDPALLRRVVENLLENARTYSEPGKPIVLRASSLGGRLLVEVIDEGMGIDAADLSRVFTPFFRSDRSRARATGGVGLGLALARRIVEAHGGEIKMDSVLGRGTTVRVSVPAA